MPQAIAPERAWWERRGTIAAMLALAVLPLLWPVVPPLLDLPGHMGRWHVALEIGHSPSLAGYYGYAWQLVGNLGMDLLVLATAPVFGLLPATKLTVILIPLLTVAGMLWCAWEAHRRLPPTAFAALPFAYAWPFQLGFVNFALAQALAFCAGGLWIRLGRQHRFGLRAMLFAPVGCAIWVAHNAGWGLFGLIAFGADLGRQRQDGRGWVAGVVHAGVQCLPLALPLLLILWTRDTSARSAAADWFHMATKLIWFGSMLRDRWAVLDLASIGVVLAFLYVGIRNPRLGFCATLGLPALLCAASFLLLPRLMMGGAYVDMRMLPAAMALGLLAIAPPPSQRAGTALAALAIAFFAARMAVTTASFALRAREQQQLTAVLNSLPRGAAVLAMVRKGCQTPWSDARADHLPAFAIIRRDAFVNEQWDLSGQQLLTVRYRKAAPFTDDPTQLVYPTDCPQLGRDVATVARSFPRAAFTHVWTIDTPPLPPDVRDLRPVARSGASTLYEVVR